MKRLRNLPSLILALVLLGAGTARAERAVRAVASGAGLAFQVAGEHGDLTLKVAGPDGAVVERTFRTGEAVSFSLFEARGSRPADGSYRWELVATPTNVATRGADGVAGSPAGRGWTESGSFSVADGAIVAGGETEPVRQKPAASARNLSPLDQVIADDLIVQGSACIGLDCVLNEAFSFDTIRMKENNTRIKFEDTSVGAFPTHDWQLTANDSASGGAEKFSIEDVTAATVPFTVTGSSPSNSIFVDSSGRVGFRTSTPVLDLHVATGNTPAMRLEQTSAGGFTAQTWDIAGNEANFFVRDVTGGSRLPFRIRPGAPTSSIDINALGNVGIGTASPAFKMHVLSSGAGALDSKVTIENTSATPAPRELLELQNDQGQATMVFKNSTEVERWANGTFNTAFVINNQAHAGVELKVSSIGDVTSTGSMNATAFNITSDRDLKKDVFPVRREEILAKLVALPIATWTLETEDIRHMGPMAQDFAAAFGLGVDNRHISMTDMAGVTMAAVQALEEQVSAKDAEIAGLTRRLADLETLVSSLAAQKR
jgi:hypothetical protein